MLILLMICNIKVHDRLTTCLHVIFYLYFMFVIIFELTVLITNTPITYLNDPEDNFDLYSGSGTVLLDSSLDVGGSCLSEPELILVRFSVTVAPFTANAALHFADCALLALPLATMLMLRNLLHSGGLWMTHQLHPHMDGVPVALEHQL